MAQEKIKNTKPRFSVLELAKHKTAEDAWLSVDGRVCDITSFMEEHPGGRQILEDFLGTEATEPFHLDLFHSHSETAIHMLDRYEIGVLEGSQADTDYELVPTGKTGELRGIRSRVDTSKPLLWQLVDLGKDYPLYVMNTSISYMRIFDMDFFEKMSRWPWWYIFFFWIPVMTACLYYAWWREGLNMLVTVVLFVVGFLTWGSIEYVLHRFIFHWQPGTKAGNWFNFFAHGAHHLTPTDASRLTFPPWFAGFLGYAIFTFFTSVLRLGYTYGCATFAGTVFGYMMYDTLHYCFHHYTMESKMWPSYIRLLRTRHLNHHYKNHENNFGVTTDLFDRMFGTHKNIAMLSRRESDVQQKSS